MKIRIFRTEEQLADALARCVVENIQEQPKLVLGLPTGRTPLPLYRALEKEIRSGLPDDVDLIPTKAYVSIEGKRCFACATLTKKTIRVGLDLGDTPFDEYVQKAKSLGAMPNLTHMVEIQTEAEVNKRLMGYMQQAYQNAHVK